MHYGNFCFQLSLNPRKQIHTLGATEDNRIRRWHEKHDIQGDSGGLRLGWVDLDLGSSPGWWAATVVTYCPSRMVEHPKSKSTQPSRRPPESPCTTMRQNTWGKRWSLVTSILPHSGRATRAAPIELQEAGILIDSKVSAKKHMGNANVYEELRLPKQQTENLEVVVNEGVFKHSEPQPEVEIGWGKEVKAKLLIR